MSTHSEGPQENVVQKIVLSDSLGLGKFAPLASRHDELRSMLRAREKALRDLAAVLRRAGPDNPHRQTLNRERARNRGRLRRLVNDLDASIAAFVAEHQREILG